MIQDLRHQFNSNFTEDKYQALLNDIHPEYDLSKDFRIAESPVFVSKKFQGKIMELFEDIRSFLEQDGVAEKLESAVPDDCRVPNEDHAPSFVAIDFAVCKDENNEFVPQLIEMQGIASLYCYQHHLCKAYQKHYPSIPSDWTYYFNGYNTEKYLQKLKKVVIAEADPSEVVIMDLSPATQKTRIDFQYTEKDLGIKAICLTDVIKEGKKLYYLNEGVKTPIRRIYNRVIFDELNLRDDLKPQFDMVSEVDLERWLAHPNWFFKVSKYCLPMIDSPYVPTSFFVSDLQSYPENLEDYVLKPLFSFAGAGVVLDVTKELLDGLKHPAHYILQKKVEYAPCIQTLDAPAKTEIRLLCVWDDRLEPILSLARLSKGRMIGVDYNKEKTWVGSSAVFFEP